MLASARACDGCGGLDVTVLLPACWAAASRPELARVSDALSGDELRGSFDAVPANALALIVAPYESSRPKSICGVTGFILPLGALGLVQYRRTPRFAWAAKRGFLLLSQRRQQLPAYRR